jgi:ribosomal protein S18 acetylase RimI-like enzyme
MAKISEVTNGDYALTIANIHMECLPPSVSDFSLLGPRTVRTFYKNVIKRKAATILTVSCDDGTIGGFVLVTRDISKLFSQTLLDNAYDILHFIFGSSFKGVVKAFCLKVASRTAAVPNVPELVYLAVLPHHRGRGYGAALVKGAEEWFMLNGVSYYELNVHETNQSALNLYLASGMAKRRSYTKSGALMHTLCKRII